MATIQSTKDISWSSWLIRISIITACTALIVIAMPRSNTPKLSAKAGSPWTQAAVTASFDFDIPKPAELYESECDSVKRLFAPYYKTDKTIAETQAKRFLARNNNGIEGLPKSFITAVASKLRAMYEVGIIPQADYAQMMKDTTAKIRIVNGKHSHTKRVQTLLTPVTAYEHFMHDQQMESAKQQLQSLNINDYFVANIIYDSLRNNSELDERLTLVARTSGQVKKGERIIDRGDIINEETVRKLEAYYDELAASQSDKSIRTTMLGRILFVFMVLAIFTVYLQLFRADYFEKPRALAMVYCLMTVFPIMVSTMVRYNLFSVYVLPLAMLPMFVRVFFDSRSAFLAHVLTVFISSTVLTLPYEFILIEVISGLVAVYSLRELSKRSQIFSAALYTTIGALLTHYSIQLMQPGEEVQLDHSMVTHFVFSGILLLLAYPLMFLIEKVFGFTSAVTLFELSDTNKDLLRRLSEVAPGTFQHSITVGNIASDIAQKIGAKSLLVRTGALYHDIGKMQNPAFFTENQAGMNPHNRMTPQESAEIIINHVTEGLKMAEKEGLPEVICDFIRTHHGAGMTKYFYITYQNAHPDIEVDKKPFTYPGPNPFTREQAILMMADGVEAASRSLKDYTEESITNLVNKIVDGIEADGYLRECPITFRDIAIAKRVLIEKLKSIYHTRITYPELRK